MDEQKIDQLAQQIDDVAGEVHEQKTNEVRHARHSLAMMCIGIALSSIIGIIYIIVLLLK